MVFVSRCLETFPYSLRSVLQLSSENEKNLGWLHTFLSLVVGVGVYNGWCQIVWGVVK